MAEIESNLDKNNSVGSHPEIRPDIGPNLSNLERSGQDGNKSDTGSSSMGNEDGNNSLSSEGLRSAEKSSGKSPISNSSKSTGNKTKGFWRQEDRGISAGAKGREAVKGFITGRPKLVGGGVLGFIVALILIFISFGNIGAFELSTIANKEIDYQSEPEQNEENSASRDILAEEDCLQGGGECPSSEASAPSESQIEADVSNGETFTKEAEDFKFTDPIVEEDLAKEGISVDTSNGKFTGLSDSSGPITPTDIADDTGSVFDKIEIGLPEWELGQTKDFTELMYDEAGSDFDIFPDTSTDEPSEDINNAVLEGAPDAPGVFDTATNTEEAPSQNATPEQQAGAQQANNSSNKLANAENTVIKDIESGKSEAQAISDASGEFDLGTEANINVALQDVCMIDEIATEASIARVPEIMTLEIRHATTLESMFSQVQDGTISSKEVAAATSVFNGNQSALLPKSTLPKEDAEPFSASEEWQNAIGNTGDGTVIDSEALPIADGGTTIVNDVDNALKDSLIGASVCDVENNPIGDDLLNAIGGIVTVADDDFTLGAGEVATVGAVGGLQIALTHTIVPAVLKYFTPVAVSGAEDSVQWMDNTGEGMNLAYNNYARSLGAIPLETPVADAEAAAAIADANNQYNHESLAYRTLSIRNPRSLVSQLALDIPISWRSILKTVADYIESWPSIITKHFADVTLLTRADAQVTPSNPGTPYQTTQYGFNNDQVDVYNPIANEQYLFSNVSYDGASASRISMLGNPNTFTNSPSGDSDNSDLLHCFVDSYATIETAASSFNQNQAPQDDTRADENCGALGMYDYKDDTPNSVDIPNDQTVVSIYCKYLVPLIPPPQTSTVTACIKVLSSSGQVNNDVVHFSQYLMDLHVMNDYTSLTNSQ